MIPKIHVQSMEYDLFVHPWSCCFRINLFICAASRLQIKIQEFLLDVMLVTSFIAWFKKMHLLQLCHAIWSVFSECSKKEDPQFNYLPLWLISKKAAGVHFRGRGGHRCLLQRTCDDFYPKKRDPKGKVGNNSPNGCSLPPWDVFMFVFCIFHSGILGGNHLISPSLVFAWHVPRDFRGDVTLKLSIYFKFTKKDIWHKKPCKDKHFQISRPQLKLWGGKKTYIWGWF